jgi:hypothetical protein
MDGLEIRTVNTDERMGDAYLHGLRTPEAMRAMWRSLIENAKGATHRPFAEYMNGRKEVARAVVGSRRLMELRQKSPSREQ